MSRLDHQDVTHVLTRVKCGFNYFFVKLRLGHEMMQMGPDSLGFLWPAVQPLVIQKTDLADAFRNLHARRNRASIGLKPLKPGAVLSSTVLYQPQPLHCRAMIYSRSLNWSGSNHAAPKVVVVEHLLGH